MYYKKRIILFQRKAIVENHGRICNNHFEILLFQALSFPSNISLVFHLKIISDHPFTWFITETIKKGLY